MTTMNEMCETIVESGILRKKDGSELTPEEIYNYSPTGELFMIFIWYGEALVRLGREVPDFMKNMLPQPEDGVVHCVQKGSNDHG